MTPPRREVVVALLLALLGAVAIGAVQPRLAKDLHAVKQRDDVFMLPPPEQLRTASLGYRAASADAIWAMLLVEYGLHWQEKRRFPDAPRYLDGILALEPDFPLVYEFADTVLVFTPFGAKPEDARLARAYLERGTRERPYDGRVWLHYGQFVAFLGPSFLKDEAEIDQWRKDGATAIATAVELGQDADRALTASSLLGKAGESAAQIQALQRGYALTDNPETRRQILLKLTSLKASTDAEAAVTAVEREWRTRLGFLSRGQALLLGPSRPAAACAGPAAYETPACPRDWSAFVHGTP